MVIYDNSTNILIIPDGTVGPDIEDRFEDKTVEITENGDYLITPDEGYDALSSVALSVNVSCDDAWQSGYTSGYTDGFNAGYDSGYTAGYLAGYEAGSEACGRDYLTVHNTSSQPTTVDITPSSVLEGTFEYRKTGGVWTTISGYTRVTLENGEKVEFRGDNPQYSEDYSNNTNIRVFGGSAEVYGNVMSLIADAAEFPSGSDYNFCGLFQNSYALTDASNLSLPSGLTQGCYQNMFKGCNTLTGTPELNATQIVQSCYEGMFEGCSSLTTAPDMPGLNNAKYAYKRMYANCGSLRNNIPASLPGGIAYYGCYYEMFENCTSLTTAPALPATEIHGSAYMNMFKGCSSLTTAPALPATLLTSGPDDIGEETTGITHYSGMFWDCTGLTTAPAILPATGTLPGSCYSHMFQGCTSLTTAPILPAEDQGSFAYGEMFRGCSNLNYVKCLSQNTNNTRDWLNGVAETGTFVKDANTTWQRGPSAIPVGWWVEDDDPGYSAMGLTLEVLSAGTIVFGKTTNGPTDAFLPYLNGVNIGTYNPAIATSGWITYDKTAKFTVDVVPGDIFKLVAAWTFQTLGNGSGYHTFSGSTATFKAYGNALSVCAGPNFAEFETFAEATSGISSDGSFAMMGLFAGCTGLTDATHLVLPKDAPNFCYASMFEGCTNLTAVPSILPASALGQSCYDTMFRCCTSLTKAPELPATTLAENCYVVMFSGCTGLTTAPALPATTLTAGCYSSMFAGCTSLNYIKCLATDISATNCTTNWVNGVASTGTFVKNPYMTGWTTGIDGIPTGWTVINIE